MLNYTENMLEHYPTLHLSLNDEGATADFANILAAQPDIQNSTIMLQGNLGAGKTTLVRYLLRALGVNGRIKSPTYAIVEPHLGKNELSIWHFDFYRFNDEREWQDAGLADIFVQRGLKLAEWPQKAPHLAAAADLVLSLDALDGQRRQLRLQPQTAVGVRLVQPWDAK